LPGTAAPLPPFVSVLMPVRNEAAFISRSLGAVLAQDYPSDRMEVLVIDGGSDDDTAQIAGDLASHATRAGRPGVRVILNEERTVPSGLNRALEVSKGEIIVRVDGHCVIAADYVRRCVEILAETGADNVGGAQRAVGEGALGTAIALAHSSMFGSGNASYRHADRRGWVETVYLGAYRREVFDRLGGFDTELVRTQDGEFNFRLTQTGGRIWLDPSIQVRYFGRSDLRSLWRQYFEYGLYKVRFMQKRGGFAAFRQLVPPAFVGGLGASLGAAALTRRPGWAGVVLGPYAIANIAASALAARRAPATIAYLPLVFATIHLAWGAGFIAGLWRWRRGFRRFRREP
jgi:succinoglycan biosynthesis protein ExoA